MPGNGTASMRKDVIGVETEQRGRALNGNGMAKLRIGIDRICVDQKTKLYFKKERIYYGYFEG